VITDVLQAVAVATAFTRDIWSLVSLCLVILEPHISYNYLFCGHENICVNSAQLRTAAAAPPPMSSLDVYVGFASELNIYFSSLCKIYLMLFSK